MSYELSRREESLFKYQPEVSYRCEVGRVPDVIKNLTSTNREVCLVAMGAKRCELGKPVLPGNTTRDVLDTVDFPVLLVPATAKFKKLNTIAFATNLCDNEIAPIHSAISLARQFSAELLLIHIMEDECKQKNYEAKVSNFLAKISDQVNYPHIYYRDVKSKDVDLGLTWLLDHRELEMLAMVHLKHDKFEQLFNQSHTQHMVRNIDLPVLVFPAKSRSVVF